MLKFASMAFCNTDRVSEGSLKARWYEKVGWVHDLHPSKKKTKPFIENLKEVSSFELVSFS